MKKIIGLVAVVAAGLGFAGQATGQDRSGFYLSGGLGAHSSDFENVFGEASYGGLLTSFKIGGHLSPQFALYFQREAAWFRVEDGFNDILYVTGITGLGGTYWFSNQTGTGYIEGGVGLADFSAVSEPNAEPVYGAGVAIGGGYELSPNVQVGGILVGSSVENDFGVSTSVRTLAVKLELKL